MPWSAFIQIFVRKVFRVTRNDRVRFQLLEGQLMEDASRRDLLIMSL